MALRSASRSLRLMSTHLPFPPGTPPAAMSISRNCGTFASSVSLTRMYSTSGWKVIWSPMRTTCATW